MFHPKHISRLPVMFVPGLAMLPFAPSVGSGLDVLKVVSVALLGFLFSISSVGCSVLFLRKGMGHVVDNAPRVMTASSATTVPPPKPYRDETLHLLLQASVLTGAISIAATRLGNAYATPFNTLFLLCSTVASYVWGACVLPVAFTKIVHPLIVGTALTLVVTYLAGWATGTPFLTALRTYKVGSLDLMKVGAGDILLHMLGPSVISFAMSMYSRKKLLKENWLVVLVAILVSSVGGLFGTAAFVRAIQLGGATSGAALVRLSVLPRNVTTALAMAVASLLGGDISIAASTVILSGITAATFGRSVMTALGIHDPVSRGLAIGASGQGLGVACIVSEPDAFPFAAMSMVLTAVAATTLVSIPQIKEALVQLATGGLK
jgi:putative effector of murein hydrolase